jgi:hypothetical protein
MIAGSADLAIVVCWDLSPTRRNIPIKKRFSLGKFSLGWKCFWGVLLHGRLPDEVMLPLGVMRRVVAPPVSTPAAAPSKSAGPDDGAVLLLGLLQREARLLDFLYEDIAPYSDEQVGAAVRSVHENSRKALDRVAQLAPVVDGVEGTVTRLASAGLKPGDTARVKLLGKVPADGNVESGTLQHRGWQLKSIALPAPDAAAKARILAPAEIEVE